MLQKQKIKGVYKVIEKKKNIQYDHKYYDLHNHIVNDLGEQISLNAVKALLESSEYVIYKYDDNDDSTLLNRLNVLWLYPLFIITIPFQWIFTGSVGIKRNSRIGRIVDSLFKI